MSFQFDHWEIDDDILPDRSVQKHRRSMQSMKAKRSVHFAKTCSVILIPSRQEYVDAGIDLWFNMNDQANAQKQVANEVRSILYDHPFLSVITAMNYLYQPKNEEEFCSAHSRGHTDVRERLNVLVIHPLEDGFKAIVQAFRSTLVQYERWVIALKHAMSFEEAQEVISESIGIVLGFDAVLIHESFALDAQGETEFDRLMSAIRMNYGSSVVAGLIIANRCPTPQLSSPSYSSRKRVDSFGCEYPLPPAFPSIPTPPFETVPLSEGTSTEASTPEPAQPKPQVPPSTTNTMDNWAFSSKEGLAEQQRHVSFCAGLREDPVDMQLHDKARYDGLDFLWREPVRDIVHILPLLLKDRQSHKSSKSSFANISSPPKRMSPKSSPSQRRDRLEATSPSPAPAPPATPTLPPPPPESPPVSP